MTLAALLLFAYLLGSIPFGLLAGKIVKGIDVREHGSGNIGATNVFRVVGKPVGIVVLILDFIKGLLPTLVAKSAVTTSLFGLPLAPDWAPILVALFAILGHNYPVWLRFKGGKGIATSGGVIVGILPWAALIALVLWLITVFITRYVAVASIVAALSIPTTMIVSSLRSGHWNLPMTVFTIVICLLAIWKHRANIQRLRNGTELRFGAKKNA